MLPGPPSRMVLLDWQLVGPGTPGVDLAWYLANLGIKAPVDNDTTVAWYREALARRLGAAFDQRWWQPQLGAEPARATPAVGGGAIAGKPCAIPAASFATGRERSPRLVVRASQRRSAVAVTSRPPMRSKWAQQTFTSHHHRDDVVVRCHPSRAARVGKGGGGGDRRAGLPRRAESRVSEQRRPFEQPSQEAQHDSHGEHRRPDPRRIRLGRIHCRAAAAN